MGTSKTYLLMACLSLFLWQTQAQSLVEVYKGTSLPTTQGWDELRFDNTMPWEEATKDLLVDPSELSAVAASALKLKVNEAVDEYGYPLYSQLGWYKTRTGFSPAIGFTVEFKAKVINSPDGAFTISGVGAGKGFRLAFSNSKLSEHSNVLDKERVLSTANNTDAFHVYRVAVAPDEKVRVWRDGTLLGELPLQSFKLDNILTDGGFENGLSPEEHGWSWMDENKAGTLTVSNDPEHVRTGEYGLFVDKGFFKNEFIPVKTGAKYDMSAWMKTISFPEGAWRDIEGWFDPAADRAVYFVADRNNPNWKYYEKLGMEGGAGFQRMILQTPTSDLNQNQMAFDDMLLSERITASRIPEGAVNLFPNGDFEDPCYNYFPEGDPRNDTCIVSPEYYRYSADAYYGGIDDDDPQWFSPPFNAEHNAAPFWHPFWGARVRMQYNKQTGNGEAGPHWARGQYSLRFFNCFGHNTEYGTDFAPGQNEDRGSNSNIKTVPIELGVNKTYTFLFSYHFAKWDDDNLVLVVKNGTKELFRKTINNSEFPDFVDQVLTFTTDADNHALQILTERNGSTPGVIYLDDFYLFEGELLPEDHTHLFFGKQTNTKGAEVEIEYIKIDNTGAYAPDGTSFSSAYEKKTAPLMTQWGEDLNPENPVLNEYPRPQLKREGWTNLNGLWDYTRKAREDFGTYNATETYRQQILVPFPIESALSGIMDDDHANQNKAYAYKRIVNITKPADTKRVMLNFGAIDWHSIIFINGEQVAEHKGGFDPFSVDITDALKAGESQEIVVHVFDPTRGGQPSGKQHMNPGGTWYTPVTGIWQTVWTEVVNPTYVTDVQLTPVDNNAVKVKVEAANAEGATATVKVLDGTTEVASVDVAVGTEISIPVANAKLWSPKTPFLYKVTVALKKGGATTDNVSSYFGMRKIEVKKLRNKPFIYLNDEATFNFATLDHGYFPDGIYTPASYEAMRFDLKKLKELGFNAVRKFEKIEPAIWYHLADSLGLLVWQDIPAAHVGTPIAELNTEAARKANFLRETAAMTKSIRNFPSVVAWIGFNDDWGRYGYDHVKNTVELFRSLNDGRLILPESGSDNYELGDVVSRHGIPIPVLHSNPYNERASICGITGRYDYVIDGHVWSTSSSSTIKDDESYAERLSEFASALRDLTLDGISGIAMVQTTDCEEEVNGLMTYDRKVFKAGPEAEEVLTSTIEFMKSKITAPILKTSGQGGELWMYKDGQRDAVVVPADWNTNIDLDESDWSEGRSAFGGNVSGVNFPWYTPWKGDQIELYARKKVFIPELEAGDKLYFKIFYDEDYEFYINGVLAHMNTGWSTNYVNFEISEEAEQAINYGGENLFAIHIVQGGGGSCMDMGVTAGNVSKDITYEEPEKQPVWIDIATPGDWMDIVDNLDGFYRLTADIDLFNESYAPIGNSDRPFRGYIDGQNYTVNCPEMTNGGDRAGLFGYADGAHFTNLRLINAAIYGGADVGILLGRGKGVTVEHVVFDVDQYQNEVYGRDHVGIVAGMLETGKLSTIKDVYVVDGKVESSDWQAAGLVGIICDTRIINSYFTGTVSITNENRLTSDNRDAAGIVARTEGGKNFFNGVMSLAEEVLSASGNEFIAYNGGGYIVIDSTTCFTRNDMILDPIYKPDRGGQFARATSSMKKNVSDFQGYALYKRAGWDMTNVWGIPVGGGYPVFRTIEGVDFAPDDSAVPSVEYVNDLKVYSVAGNIVMSASQPTAVWIYSLEGALVERTDINGTQTLAMPSGIYIIKSAANGVVKASKIINR